MDNILSALKTKGVKSVVLDTDAYNEIDDQFALSYLALKGDRAVLKAICAAPFLNERSESPEDGMLKSYNEILRLTELLDRGDIPVYMGSREFMSNESTPIDTPAARAMIREAKLMPAGEKLYVVAIGAITNVASALLLDPSIKESIVVVWLGGQALHMCSTVEFNMQGDIPAARAVFSSGVPLVMVPCRGMCDTFTVSLPELEAWLDGRNELCTYLSDNVRKCFKNPFCSTRVLWDVVAAAVICAFETLDAVVLPRPIITYDSVYAYDASSEPMVYIRALARDPLMADLFRALLSL